MTVGEQVRALLAMALCGALLGCAYEVMGLLRRGPVTTAAADVLFGLLAAAAVIATALAIRCEAFRLYTLLGTVGGFGLYEGTIGTAVRALKAHTVSLLRRLAFPFRNSMIRRFHQETVPEQPAELFAGEAGRRGTKKMA